MNEEMKNMASRLGIGFPPDASEHEQLAAIANQMGMPDYYYNVADNAKLYNALKDMCGENGIPDDIAGMPYDPELEPDYIDENGRRTKKEKDDKENSGEDSKEEGSEDKEPTDSDGPTDSNSSSDDRPEDLLNNEPSHPGEEGPGFNQNNQNNPGANQEGVQNQGVDAPNQTHEQRDDNPSRPGYGDGPSEYGEENENSFERQSNVGGQSQQYVSQQPSETPHRNLDDETRDNGSGNNVGSSATYSRRPNHPNQQTQSSRGNQGSNSQRSNGSSESSGPAPAGNGYGALRNGNAGARQSGGSSSRETSNSVGDSTSNARRNLEHNNRVKNSEKEDRPGATSRGGGLSSREKGNESGGLFSGLGSRIRNGIGNRLGRKQDRSIGDDSGSGGESRKENYNSSSDFLRRKLVQLFLTHPFLIFASILLFFMAFLLLVVVVLGGSDLADSGVGWFTSSSRHIDYGNYSLSSEGKSILHEPLDTFLSKHGSSLENFNSLIEKNVEKAGYGTREGVVAAAVTLIGELGDNYNVLVPYYWGGGHGDGVAVGALGKWGSTQCHTYANGQSYNYCGLDCSGFVPWAIKNGGFNRAQGLAGGFFNDSGAQKVSLNSDHATIQPGDLLESSHHVVLVVGIDDNAKQYICAEAKGNEYGVLFTRRSFGESGYWGVSLENYYNNSSNVRGK